MMATVYSHKRYNELVEKTFKKVVELGQLKGGEYAGDTDRLANFRRNAERFGVTSELIWGVYAGKHWDSISQFVNDTQNLRKRNRLEGLAGRADDLIVYLLLFKAMVEEREENEKCDRKEESDEVFRINKDTIVKDTTYSR